MTGHAMPWSRDDTDERRARERANKQAADLAKQQSDMKAQQEAEISQTKKKLNQRQIAMLRARFGVAGSTGTGGASNDVQAMSDTSGSLYSRITGH